MPASAEPPDEHDDPVLELLVNLTHEGTVIAAFQSAHDKFHRYHGDCLRLAAAATSDDRALEELLRTLDAYGELFNEHHFAEDHYLFPALRRVEPALDTVVDQLANQHQQRGSQLTVVLEQAHGLESDAARESGIAPLVGELRKLRAMVEDHLLFEEEATVPVVRTWTSWPV